jgi:Ca2+-binding RTX toxin-like protein
VLLRQNEHALNRTGNETDYSSLLHTHGLQRQEAFAQGENQEMRNRLYTDGNDRILDNGTTDGEYIHGMGGDDLIYAGLGHDTIHGGNGNDTIAAYTQTNSSVRGWGYDTVLGGGNNDTLYFANTTNDVVLYGDDKTNNVNAGNDKIYSGSGHDYLVGGAGNDEIWGGAGNDQIWGDTVAFIQGGRDNLYGGAGQDTIHGGGGNDWIVGGTGKDILTGSANTDSFVYAKGDSNVGWLYADRIQDFDRQYDWIVVPISGANYSEHLVRNTGNTEKNYNAAFSLASQHIHNDDFVFLTDGVNGYLFADLDQDSKVDTSIVLIGLDSLSDFAATDIFRM